METYCQCVILRRLALRCRYLSTAADAGQHPRPLKAIPGPSGFSALPYVGLMFELKPFTKFDVRRMIELFASWKDRYGPLVKGRVGMSWMVILYDPEDIARVFRADSNMPFRCRQPFMETYDRRRGITAGLVALNGEEWHSLRSPTQKSMMRPKSIDKYTTRLGQIADEFVSRFEKKTSMDNLPDQLMEYTAEGVGMLCFNARLGYMKTEDKSSELMEFTKTYLHTFGESVYRLPLYTIFRTPLYRQFEEAADYLNALCESYINDALAKVGSRNASDIEDSLLFDLLSTPGMTSGMTKRTLVDVFVGGIDSTANAMTFLFYFLAKHQDKQQKLHEELCDVIPEDGQITEDVLGKLVYLKACFKESLRMVFPINGGTSRILDKDIVLQGYNIPKGTLLLLCNGVICRDESYFPQHDRYTPERWLRAADTRTDVNPFAHLPFGFGPRKCIGQRFAEQEIYICTAKMFKRYRLFCLLE